MAALSQFGPNRGSNQFGAGSLSAGLSAGLSAAGGLGNFQAVRSGRSSMDPSRMTEQAIRQARSKGDFRGALAAGALGTNLMQAQNQMQQELFGQQKLQESMNQMTGGVLTPTQPQAPQTTPPAAQTSGQPAPQGQPQNPMDVGPAQIDMTKAGWANALVGGNTGTRAGNIQAAKQDPNKFNAIRLQYNKLAEQSGMMMDEQGNIVRKQATPSAPNRI